MRPTEPKIGIQREAAGSVIIIALLVIALLSLLGLTLLTVGGMGQSIAYNSIYSEGALFAADAGAQEGINQLGPSPTTSITAYSSVDNQFGSTYRFWSGSRSNSTYISPQPLQFVSTRVETGYSIAIGTGYNPTGYAFYSYQIDATGSGPGFAQRQVEVRAEYGPVPQ